MCTPSNHMIQSPSSDRFSVIDMWMSFSITVHWHVNECMKWRPPYTFQLCDDFRNLEIFMKSMPSVCFTAMWRSWKSSLLIIKCFSSDTLVIRHFFYRPSAETVPPDIFCTDMGHDCFLITGVLTFHAFFTSLSSHFVFNTVALRFYYTQTNSWIYLFLFFACLDCISSYRYGEKF